MNCLLTVLRGLNLHSLRVVELRRVVVDTVFYGFLCMSDLFMSIPELGIICART